MRAHPLVAVAAVSMMSAPVLTACGGLTGDPSLTLEACAGDADIADNTLIVTDLKDSVHELIQCGQLSFLLLSSVVSSALVVAGEPSSLPEAFAFQDGAYVTTGTGVTMTTQLLAGSDTPGLTAGEPLEHDVFDPASYLVDPVSTRDGDTVTVAFSDTGPLVGLLGRGAAPTSPLVLTVEDLATSSAVPLAALGAASVIRVDDVRAQTTISYDVDVPENDVGALLIAQSAVQRVQSASGSREALAQTLTTPTWELAFVNTSAALSGTVGAAVRGGPFDFDATLVYDGVTPEPTITYACAP